MNSFRELIYTIKERPAMYIGNGNIYALQAFIDGWYFRDRQSVTDVGLLNDFQTWVQIRYQVKESQSWSRILAFYSHNEHTAIEVFFRDFDLFIAQRDGK